MWLNRRDYDRIVLDSEKRNAVCAEQARHIATLTATMDWLRVRVTQIEQERAQLLYNYMGIKVETPSIERTRVPGPSELASAVAPYFTDMGDDEAAKQNVSWANDGTLKYGKQS